MARIKRNLHQAADLVMATALRCGVRISPSSRLGQMYRIFKEIAATPDRSLSPDHPDFAVACEGTRDMFHLCFAIEQLCRPDPPMGFVEKLHLAVADPPLPQDRMEDSAGRDAQCELYVAAITAKAGLSPVIAEPDLQCQFEGKPFGVAIKRIKNLSQFERRVRAAMKQIVRSDVPGAVALDLTIALNRTNAPVVTNESDSRYGLRKTNEVGQVGDGHFKKMIEWAKGTKIRGLLLLNHDIRYRALGGWSMESTTVGSHLSPWNQNRRREFDRFADQFMLGHASR